MKGGDSRDEAYVMPGAHVLPHLGTTPRMGARVLVASGAAVIGDVVLGDDVSIWFNTVLRGDMHRIRVGARTNVQDNATLHVTEGVAPCLVGADVTIGHNAIVHACTVEDLCLVGMGSIILDKAVIRTGSIVAAGAVVPPGKEFPPGSLLMGSPAKVARSVTPAEAAALRDSAQRYMLAASQYRPGA
jgi:carbonic anhydrase/acetyltransferase-like protein (isoleucine patch superfamily)